MKFLKLQLLSSVAGLVSSVEWNLYEVCPPYMYLQVKQFFSIRQTSYNLRGNGVNLCVPKFNLNFMRNYFTYKCAQLWNKLPEDVKLAGNVSIFKSKLRSTQL